MPRSGYWTQQCKCGTDKRAAVSISIGASTLGKVPRQKSRTVTIYICEGCGKEPSRKTRMHIVRSVRAAMQEALTRARSAARKHK